MLPAALCVLTACSEVRPPTALPASSILAGPQNLGGEGGEYTGPYMTAAQFAANYGESKPEFDMIIYPGEFYNNNQNFKAKARVTAWLVTDATATLTARVIAQNGATINENQVSFAVSTFLPNPIPIDTMMIALVSTNNHTSCITGKSAGSASAKTVVVIELPWRITQLWSGTRIPLSTDVTLGGCPPPDDQSSPPGGGSGACLGDGYWQQWLWYVNGEITDEWWESICSSQVAT